MAPNAQRDCLRPLRGNEAGAPRRSPTAPLWTPSNVLAALFILLPFSSTKLSAASFDCKKTATQGEKFICADAQLSILDDKLGAAYVQAMKITDQKTELKRQQQRWVETRNACADETCLKKSYEARIAQLSEAHNAELKAKIVAILEDIRLEEQKFGRPSDPLCSQFLDDFRQQKNVEHILPIIQTEDYDDPRLKTYRNKCPNLKLNRHMGYSPNVYYEGLEEESEETREAAASYISYGTKNFKLYEVDINNNPKDGKEHIFYDQASQFVKPEMLAGKIVSAEAGSYLVVDFRACETRGGVGTAATTLPKERIADFHGPIEYREKFYVYVLEVTKNKRANLYLGRFQRPLNGEPGFGQACVYRVLSNK